MRLFCFLKRKLVAEGMITALCLASVAQQGARAEAYPYSESLTGDWGGFRTMLFRHGVDFKINDQNEYWGCR